MTDRSNIGDKCTNAAWLEVWTCPACYHDHHTQVTACASCATALSCTIVREPVPVCTIVDPNDRPGDDE